MGKATIKHISDTALWVAHYRAVESERKDAIFNDPYARMLAGERGRVISKRMPNAKMIKWIMAVRTVAIDRLVLKGVERGVDTVINLGAGLDTRPYRMPLPKNLKWIEVDFPDMIEYKEEKLKNERPVCELTRIACDLSSDEERKVLLEKINETSAKALIITEGVTVYLSEEENEKLSRDLLSNSSFIYWILDYFQGSYKTPRFKKMQRALKESPFKFNVVDKVDFFLKRGWKVFDNIFLSEESVRLNRFPPMQVMLPVKLLLFFANEKLRKKIKESSGIVMLSR